MTAWCPVTWPDWANSLFNIVLCLALQATVEERATSVL
jgi:hypothetical protein